MHADRTDAVTPTYEDLAARNAALQRGCAQFVLATSK